jgi:hypothetical protein
VRIAVGVIAKDLAKKKNLQIILEKGRKDDMYCSLHRRRPKTGFRKIITKARDQDPLLSNVSF